MCVTSASVVGDMQVNLKIPTSCTKAPQSKPKSEVQNDDNIKPQILPPSSSRTALAPPKLGYVLDEDSDVITTRIRCKNFSGKGKRQKINNNQIETPVNNTDQIIQKDIEFNCSLPPLINTLVSPLKKDCLEKDSDKKTTAKMKGKTFRGKGKTRKSKRLDCSKSEKPVDSSKTVQKNKLLNRSKSKLQSQEAWKKNKVHDGPISTHQLQEALDVIGSCSTHVNDLDIVIIPPDGIESDVEFINDDDNSELVLSNIADTAGTFEIHDGNEEIEDLTEADGIYQDFAEFQIKVNEIVRDCTISIEEKVKKLTALSPKIDESCIWNGKSTRLPLLSPKDTTYSKEVHDNRANVAEKYASFRPHEFFEFYFADGLLEHLVLETNRYAHRCGDLTFNVQEQEMKAFIGILILSGYHKLPQTPMYWDSNIDTTVHIVQDAMSRNRFQLIKRYIHCANNDYLDPSDKYFKVRPLYDIMNQKLTQFGELDSSFSIDEQMVPYSGMHSSKQRMKDKSIRFGYKNFWITGSTGYPYNCVPYCGAKGIGGDPGKALTMRVTLQLALTLQSPESSELFYDNWFASYRLLPLFSAIGLGTTCTIQNTRTNKCPIISDSTLKKEPRGTYRYQKDEFSGSTLVKWNDNNVVKLASNIHGVDPIDQVERYSQAEKKRVKVDRPLLIAKYNQGMGGVDVFDGHVASYRISIRGKKWWWPHLINTIDCLKAASYSLYTIANSESEKKISSGEFV